ncbi:acyl-CoA dehydratase activase-related protein [Adlercreutzia agrestimuris]|uniref:acyl-CoA dehydratase activase-related protein n=1 Tax=Adlercreutzia agrestimuris TaxID=2941324 RepID=UPI0020414667|nr:acyl-CoA dehydratase activase-related protein [Adlercreutzia agrestimuris]
MPEKAPWADVFVVGIPRSLLYYRFGVLWTTFFEALGRHVVVSEATDKAIADRGEQLSVDECCLASKVFMGHVDSLVGRCDAVFVPSYPTADHRSGFCTKFQSVTDMVRNTFRDKHLEVISCEVGNVRKMRDVRRPFEEMALRMGVSRADAHKAFKTAWSAQAAHDKACNEAQERVLRQLVAERRSAATQPLKQPPLGILVVAHPYIAHDTYLSGAVLDALRDMGAQVVFADALDHDHTYKKSFEFSDTMPWIINRELIGAILSVEDKVDGIVLISAFPCGPDSMTDDAIMRCIQGKPILNLMIDAQSGTAGVETRVESFVDILRFQQKGGYTHG